MSDSEGEQDGPHNQVTVTQKVRDRGVAKNAVNAIRYTYFVCVSRVTLSNKMICKQFLKRFWCRIAYYWLKHKVTCLLK